MLDLNQLDLTNGIAFTAVDSRDVDKMASALTDNGINFTRSHCTVTIILTDGSEGIAKAECLTIDPKVNQTDVAAIYQQMIHDQFTNRATELND